LEPPDSPDWSPHTQFGKLSRAVERLANPNPECRGGRFANLPRACLRLPGSDRVEKLIQTKPEENVSTDQAIHFLKKLIDNFDHLRYPLEESAKENSRILLKAHTRVRKASQKKGVRYQVEPNLPPDVLGAYVYLPLK